MYAELLCSYTSTDTDSCLPQQVQFHVWYGSLRHEKMKKKTSKEAEKNSKLILTYKICH